MTQRTQRPISYLDLSVVCSRENEHFAHHNAPTDVERCMWSVTGEEARAGTAGSEKVDDVILRSIVVLVCFTRDFAMYALQAAQTIDACHPNGYMHECDQRL